MVAGMNRLTRPVTGSSRALPPDARICGQSQGSQVWILPTRVRWLTVTALASKSPVTPRRLPDRIKAGPSVCAAPFPQQVIQVRDDRGPLRVVAVPEAHAVGIRRRYVNRLHAIDDENSWLGIPGPLAALEFL